MDRRPKDVRPWAIIREGWDYVEGIGGALEQDFGSDKRPSA